MESDLINEIRQSTNGNYILGNEPFEDVANMIKRRLTPEKAGRAAKKV